MDRNFSPGSSEDWHMTDDLHAEQGKGDPFAAAMRATRMPMLITDPRQPDNPIVFANDAFLRLTGYPQTRSSAAIVGFCRVRTRIRRMLTRSEPRSPDVKTSVSTF